LESKSLSPFPNYFPLAVSMFVLSSYTCFHWWSLCQVQCDSFKSEQLPEDGKVGPKHVAVDCGFNVILKFGDILNIFKLH
jgi:hypothetical protein